MNVPTFVMWTRYEFTLPLSPVYGDGFAANPCVLVLNNGIATTLGTLQSVRSWSGGDSCVLPYMPNVKHVHVMVKSPTPALLPPDSPCKTRAFKFYKLAIGKKKNGRRSDMFKT